MPWKTMDVREQRVRFVVAAIRKEKPFSALCQEFGISRPTGLLWRERYARRPSRDCRAQPASASQSDAGPRLRWSSG